MKKPEIFVLDTNLFVSSLFRKDSPPFQLYSSIIQNGQFTFSKDTYAELCGVLARKKFDKYIPLVERQAIINSLLDYGEFFTPEKNFQLCRDPKDNIFLDVAVAAQADVLVTGDDDLLALKAIDAIPIITAAEVLKRMT